MAKIKSLRKSVRWYLLIKIYKGLYNDKNNENFEILKIGKSILDILKMSIFEKGQIKISKNCEKVTCDHNALISVFLWKKVWA